VPEIDAPTRSYRADPQVPPFDDAKPLFVFDGHCVLCSGGAAFLMRHDRSGRINLASAQSHLGVALYRYYGIALDDSYLFILRGRAFTKSRGYLELVRHLGGWWRMVGLIRLLPERLRDWAYDRVAANRYRWFGRKDEACVLLTPDQRRRLVGLAGDTNPRE